MHDLGAELRRLRSSLVARIVQRTAQKPATIAYLARAARANVAYADAAVATFARPAISFDLRVLTTLSSPTSALPLLHPVAVEITEVPIPGSFGTDGEFSALALSVESPYTAW